MADEWENLDQLRQQWKELFGEELVVGIGITPDELPLIQRCIEEQSTEPLKRYFEKMIEQGRIP